MAEEVLCVESHILMNHNADEPTCRGPHVQKNPLPEITDHMHTSSSHPPAEGGHARDILPDGDCSGEVVMDHGVHQHQIHHRLHICGHAEVLIVVTYIEQNVLRSWDTSQSTGNCER